MTYQLISERKLKRKVKIKHPEEVYDLVKRYAKENRELCIWAEPIWLNTPELCSG
jgi:hypothetical protein